MQSSVMFIKETKKNLEDLAAPDFMINDVCNPFLVYKVFASKSIRSIQPLSALCCNSAAFKWAMLLTTENKYFNQ